MLFLPLKYFALILPAGCMKDARWYKIMGHDEKNANYFDSNEFHIQVAYGNLQ